MKLEVVVVLAVDVTALPGKTALTAEPSEPAEPAEPAGEDDAAALDDASLIDAIRGGKKNPQQSARSALSRGARTVSRTKAGSRLSGTPV